LDASAFDAMPVSELKFNSVRFGGEALMGEVDGAFSVVEQVVDEAIAALCAQAAGAMESVHGATNEFLKTRKHFGQPIGRFQVWQHRMVDMHMALEESRSLTFLRRWHWAPVL
jgi:alkylation response protein AidB-like acyl-CoA dehydrogenase